MGVFCLGTGSRSIQRAALFWVRIWSISAHPLLCIEPIGPESRGLEPSESQMAGIAESVSTCTGSLCLAPSTSSLSPRSPLLSRTPLSRSCMTSRSVFRDLGPSIFVSCSITPESPLTSWADNTPEAAYAGIEHSCSHTCPPCAAAGCTAGVQGAAAAEAGSDDDSVR